MSFRGHAHSHATGPDEHAYQLDLELYGEVDDQDIKQVGASVAAGEVACARVSQLIVHGKGRGGQQATRVP